MCKKLIYPICAVLVLATSSSVRSEVFSDDFERARDYLTVGVTRSGWDGFLGLNEGETVDILNASVDRAGQLYIESTGAYWHEPWDPLGPFLFKNVEGDFIVTVKVTEFAGTLESILEHNAAGLMARAIPEEGGPGEDEDWVSIAYFPTWTAFIAWNADDGVRTEVGQTTGTWLGDDTFAIAEQYPYLQIERAGNDFHLRISEDGVNFIPLTDPAYMGIYDSNDPNQAPLVISRPDLDGLTLQVGLFHATFSTNTGYVAFDDFSVDGPMVLSAVKAYGPNPTGGAKDVPRDEVLGWIPGMFADKHDVYFGTVFDDVNEASIADPRGVLVGQNQDGTTYDPGLLDFGQTYYWRVDEVNDLNPDSPWRGSVWSFTAANFTVVDNFEDYNDTTNKIYDMWVDYFVNNTGMTVGHFDPPFAERTVVHSGRQAMYMRYDNDGTVNEGTDYEQSGTLTFSETEREWADPQDWTANDVQSLTIWFRGLPPIYGSFTEGPPITMTARGEDIWTTSDQFHYAYKQLSGNGSITAKVVSLTDTHQWAKAGVMIRELLTADSKHIDVVVQPGAGVAFQRRSSVGGASTEIASQADITAPHWVRLTRSGNRFTAEHSVDGANWETLGTPLTMTMLVDTYVGLCLTSHNVNETCTAEFSDVTIDGTVTGEWRSQDIGIESNIPEPMYIVLEDNAGNSAVVKHSDSSVSATSFWTEWNMPLAEFTGVDPQAIKKMSIGVGDRVNPQAGGSGDLYIDDIRLYLPPN